MRHRGALREEWRRRPNFPEHEAAPGKRVSTAGTDAGTFTCKEILGKLAGRRCISLVALDLKNPHLEIGTHLNIQSKTVNPYNNSFELLVKDLERYKRTDIR